MLTGVHILMTYKCSFECDHCFLFSGPNARGTMTLTQIRHVLEESRKIGSIEWIFFEGGEPFLFYPSMLEGIRSAREMGFKVGIVTNAYSAVSDEDAEACFKPLADLGVENLSISDDSFHFAEEDSPAKFGLAAALKLGIPTTSISIQIPFVESMPGQGQGKGAPVIGGGALFKGRAVEKLTAGLPRRSCLEFTRCLHEDFQSPSRVHVDCYGNVHLCQGISMGNMWRRPFSELVREYEADAHPICGPLNKGGPVLLAKQYDVDIGGEYVDECHFCYLVRRALIGSFPEYLAPKQLYGLE